MMFINKCFFFKILSNEFDLWIDLAERAFSSENTLDTRKRDDAAYWYS